MSREALLAGAAALLGAVLYLDSIPNDFVFDDRLVVERNAQIRSLRNLPEIFETPYHRYYGHAARDSGHYRPVAIASLALDHALFGTKPAGYHASNVLLHSAASGLVVLVGISVGLVPPVALVGGLLFAAHPIHTEAVANVSGRAELLAAVFFLLACVLYVRGRRAVAFSRRKLLAFAALSLLIALLSKENAITFVGVAALWELLLGPPRRTSRLRDGLKGLLWVVLPVMAYFAARWLVLGAALSSSTVTSVLDNPLVDRGLLVRLLTAVALVARYFGLLLFPQHLSPDYSWAQIVPVERPWDPVFVIGALLVAATVSFAVMARHRSPTLAWVALFGACTYSVVSNFPVAIATIMAERLLYLPSVAFCLLAASLWPHLRARIGTGAAMACAIVVLGAFSTRTVARNLDWRDDFTLFSKAAVTSPRSAKVLNNLGAELLKRGENTRALEQIEKARAIAPDWAEARINLAQALLANGNPARAEQEARDAVRLLPKDPLAHVKLAEVLEAHNRLEDAARELEEAIALDPADADARLRLGMIATGLGDLRKAERELTAAVELDPQSIPARTSLGLLFRETRRPDRAVTELREAVRLDPGSTRARNNLGNVLRDAGSLDESIRELERAVALDERFAPSHFNLGLSFEKAGRVEEARAQYRRALEIDPAHSGSLRAMTRLGF